MFDNFYYAPEDILTLPERYVNKKVFKIYAEKEEAEILECDDEDSAKMIVELLNSLPVRTPK